MSRRFDIPCRIEVRHGADFLAAHLHLPDGVLLHPGDRVRVHGSAVRVPFGQSATIDRTATVTRAGPLARAWTRLKGHFEMTELYEVSFSGGRL